MKPKQTPQQNKIKLPYEVFDLCEKATTVAERVQILQDNATFGIKTLLQVNFREDLVFDLPEGTPPYKESSAVPGTQSRHFEKLVYDLKNLIKGSPLSGIKKQTIYINLLESLSAQDAKIVIAVKDKNLKSLYKTLTESTIKKAYPTLKLSTKED